jgi:hypothetical protein
MTPQMPKCGVLAALMIFGASMVVAQDQQSNPNQNAAAIGMDDISMQQSWNEIFISTEKLSDTIHRQLESAGREYPQLVAVLKILIAYTGFTHHKMAESILKPVGPDPVAPVITFPIRPSILMRACAEGNFFACRELGIGYIDPLRMTRKTCASLWQDYFSSKNREREHLIEIMRQSTTQPVSYELRERLFREATTSEQILQELRERHCLAVIADHPQ